MGLKTSSLFFAFWLIGLTPQALMAQTSPQQSNSALVKQFRDGFMQGCKTGKAAGVSNQMRYCTCLANSYQARYDGQELSIISQLVNTTGANGSRLVNLMMTPESKACAAKS